MTAGQRAQSLLDEWQRTSDYITHTCRGILGNIYGYPEPDSQGHLVDTTFRAVYIDPIADMINNRNPLMELFDAR